MLIGTNLSLGKQFTMGVSKFQFQKIQQMRACGAPNRRRQTLIFAFGIWNSNKKQIIPKNAPKWYPK